MQKHVFDCLTILIFVQIFQTTCGSSDVGYIDSRCLQSNKTGHKISRTLKYDEGPSTCDKNWGPETPSNVDLSFRCDEGKVVLSWTAKNRCCRSSLGGYLLYINTDMVGARFGTEKVLIKLSKSKSKTPEHFRYTCLNISPSIGKLYVTVWALTRKMEKCGKVFTSLSLPHDDIAAKCVAEKCVCQSEVYIQPIVGIDQTTVHGQISIPYLPAGTKLYIELVNDKGITKQAWDETWKENQTHISVVAKNLTEDTYQFMVHRMCQTFDGSPFSCGRYRARVVESEKVTLNRSNMFIRGTSFAIDDKDQYTGSDNTITAVVGCAIGLFVIIVIIVAVIIYHLGVHVQRPKHRFMNAQHIHRLLKEEAERKKVAIIFAKDSQLHTQNVYKFGRALLRNGVFATVIDESSNHGMMQNWIDEGESIPDRFDVIIFVLTPLLYDLSRRSAIDVTTAVEDGVIKHRLPAAVLHALQVKPYFRSGKCPSAFVVTLDKSPKETNPLLKRFLQENKSVLYPKPIFMKDMQRDIRHLIKKIYRNKPIMV